MCVLYVNQYYFYLILLIIATRIEILNFRAFRQQKRLISDARTKNVLKGQTMYDVDEHRGPYIPKFSLNTV